MIRTSQRMFTFDISNGEAHFGSRYCHLVLQTKSIRGYLFNSIPMGELFDGNELLDELFQDLQHLDPENGVGNERVEPVRPRVRRRRPMKEFYQRRKDIFSIYFDDRQLLRTFRFDRTSILYITGLRVFFRFSLYHR